MVGVATSYEEVEEDHTYCRMAAVVVEVEMEEMDDRSSNHGH